MYKKPIKDQRNICLNTFFNMLANSVSVHYKMQCLRLWYFFIPPVSLVLAIFLKLKNVWQLQKSAIHSNYINFFLFFLIKYLFGITNRWNRWSQCENKICQFIRKKHIILSRNLFYGHIRKLDVDKICDALRDNYDTIDEHWYNTLFLRYIAHF